MDRLQETPSHQEYGFPTVIEQYTRNTRFCLICNYVSKILPALQSRCTRFRFAPLNEEQLQSQIRRVVASEKWAASSAETLSVSVFRLPPSPRLPPYCLHGVVRPSCHFCQLLQAHDDRGRDAGPESAGARRHAKSVEHSSGEEWFRTRDLTGILNSCCKHM